jgi:sugar phosphate isomerase/epimerase
MQINRRELLATLPLSFGAAMAFDRPVHEPFGYCLNTSTLRGQNLDIVALVEIAAKVGYQAIEPWISELEQYAKNGGDLKGLGRRIQDHGLQVPSAIGFAEWAVDVKERRQRGLEQAKRDMDLVRRIGGTRIAAPPTGFKEHSEVNLLAVAERYRALLDSGASIGVVPQVELWGFSPVIRRLGQAALVAMESGHPHACILADVYHLYKGGSELSGLGLLRGESMHVLHMNDYPALPRASITDAERVYPGDGVAPLKEILTALQTIGYHGFLSLELFNREYWKLDAATVARAGLEKMRHAVANSLKAEK